MHRTFSKEPGETCPLVAMIWHIAQTQRMLCRSSSRLPPVMCSSRSSITLSRSSLNSCSAYVMLD